MRLQHIAAIALASALLITSPASAMISGYLEVPDIAGESRLADSGASQTQSVGGAQSRTVGAYQSETIKGGKAVVIGALWNGSDNPPRRNSKGTVQLTLQRGALSDSLLRLKNQKRSIPSLKLVTDGKTGPKTVYELQRVLVSSYSVSGTGDAATEEIELAFHSVTW